MLMLCKNLKSSIVIADFTGPTSWLKNEANLQVVCDLFKKGPFLLLSDIQVPIPENEFAYLGDSTSNIESLSSQFLYEELESSESDAIVITNNATRIRSWNSLNISTVYLETDEFDSPLQHEHMPDEIWSMEDLKNFVYHNEEVGCSYNMELIGLNNSLLQPYLYYTFNDNNRISNVKFDVIFAGRYFKVSDNRQYVHLLSRALKEFKFEVRKNRISSSRQALFNLFNELLLNVIEDNKDITLITAVPPRPSQQHRFFGFEDYYTGEITLDFEVLYTQKNYQSPKQFRQYESKYNCVKDAFSCTKNVSGHILLLDDIYTTGVTTSECVRILLDSGASKVTVVPIAHTQACPPNQYLLKGFFDNEGIEYVPRFYKNNGINFWIREENNKGSYSYEHMRTNYLKDNNFWDQNDPSIKLLENCYDAKAIIFDLDNTLIETDSLEKIRYQKIYSEEEKQFMINNSTQLISSDTISALMARGIKIGVVTRSKEQYAKTLLELHDYPYDVLVSRFDCFRTKPFPDPFIKCASLLKVQSDEIQTIGNDDDDINASHAAHMQAFKVASDSDFELLNDILEGILSSRI